MQPHFLAVDHDLYALQHSVQLLHHFGARVDTADNIQLALQYLTQNPDSLPHAIICDLTLPQIDGVALLRQLAQMKYKGAIILVSAMPPRLHRFTLELAQAHGLRVAGVLEKPLVYEELYRILQPCFNITSARTQLPDTAITRKTLKEGILSGGIFPYFQPQVCAKTGRTLGVEALARWEHPDHGLLTPALFIPYAERHGLIAQLTNSILQQSLAEAAQWQKEGCPITVAVNFSPSLLTDLTLPERLVEACTRNGIAPQNLIVEITETGVCDNLLVGLDIILRLHLKGFRISIDDFGTGRATLEGLRRFPFSELKIDRMFVNGAGADQEIRAFFQSAVDLAKRLDLETVAEGVETESDFKTCQNVQCDAVQGFYIARPMRAEAIMERLLHEAA